MLSLIPIPKFYIESEGCFKLNDNVQIESEFDLKLLEGRAEIVDSSDFKILRDDEINEEGYKLSVDKNSITIKASTKTGAYYALQSIRKIGRLDLGERGIPCCEIDDEPRFKWRGVNFDEARYFFGIETVKRLLDNMFSEKLNVLHWHLSDDQGWRIEIKKYPLLTEIGSKREYSQVGGWKSFKIDKTPHSGFYTQEQIKDIVEYARERGIMIVPEIDFPAHCASAIAAYKYLACFEKDTEVPGYFGGLIPQWRYFDWRWNRTVCCAKESTYEFIFGVLDEICELFDSPYIHMGGDEAPQNEWKRCDKCQALMRKEGLKNEFELQGWFENKLCNYLKSKGRKLIAWNEVLKSNEFNKEDKNTVVQYWTPKRDKKAEEYINSGGEAILSNHQAFYFDMTYAEIPLRKTYSYTPEAFGINSKNIKNVLGYEGELWSEWIADSEKLDLCAFPRLQALAELAWSPNEKIDFDDFKARLDDYKPIFDKLGINYAVDKISLPESRKMIYRIMYKFHRGNPYLETELNKKYKAKGER
ncbi:MAG: beta-N-acetylhexosaminidase [Eubacterium sp.]